MTAGSLEPAVRTIRASTAVTASEPAAGMAEALEVGMAAAPEAETAEAMACSCSLQKMVKELFGQIYGRNGICSTHQSDSFAGGPASVANQSMP